MTAPEDLDAAVAYLLGQKLLSDPADLYRRLTTLEAHMTAVDDSLARLNTALENVRGDVARLAGELAAVKDELAQSDPKMAARLEPLVQLAEQIAAATPEPEAPPAG